MRTTTTGSRRRPLFPLYACAALALAPAAARAQAYTDPAGDLRAGYAGPTTADLDVVGGVVRFDGTSFTLRGTLAGPIDLAANPALAYVYGINRGAGVARFGDLAPGVLFDAVVVVRPNGPNAINVFSPTPTLVGTPAVTIFGNTFEAIVPSALLPSTGFAVRDYTFNLWPRVGAGDNNAQISDFGPDNSSVAAVVPEPATYALLAPALVALVAARRRRAR